ncbi:MAG: cytochrome P450 [Actinomycetota bacterium]
MSAERQAVDVPISPVLLELFEPENRADPYPLYRRYRETEPMHFSDIGVWTLTRYEDILAVLRDDRFSVDPRNATELERFFPATDDTPRPFEQMAGLLLLFTDPPDHTRMRNLVNKAFTRRVVEELRPHVQDVVNDLLDQVSGRGEMDVISDFAFQLPALVICELMGVPVEDRDKFHGMSADIAPILDPITPPDKLEKAMYTAGLFIMYFVQLLEERRKDPQDDFLSALLAAEEHDQKLSGEEVIALCVLIFIAGHETTQNLIGNGLLGLLRHPDQLELLRSDPSLTRSAIEELLRFDSPVQLTGRSALTDVEVGGRTIRKGQEAVVLLGAGNRDPAVFDDPDRLDITRDKVSVLSFGGGVHFCLGAPLARLEGQIAFRTLLDRFPKIELATDAPEFRETLTLRGLKSLPVRL